MSASYSSNSKELWNFNNSVKAPPPLSQSGQFISDHDKKASIFNQYFNSVFSTEDKSSITSLHDSVYFHPKLIDNITFTPANVYEELVNLQRDKACGPDCIPAHLLKEAADFICSPLSRIFQLSIDSGCLPRFWLSTYGCDNSSMAKILITTIQMNLVLSPSETWRRTHKFT